MSVTVLSLKDHRDVDPSWHNVTSHSTTWTRQLSPFILGPVPVQPLDEEFTSKNVENAWQYSKVYYEFLKDGELTEEYLSWAKKGFDKAWADRYPMGRGRTPEFSLHKGERLPYVEARRQLYIPLYAMAARRTEAYERLREEYARKGTLVLLDFDAYDHRKIKLAWRDVIYNKKKKMGHGFVLAMMLEGYI